MECDHIGKCEREVDIRKCEEVKCSMMEVCLCYGSARLTQDIRKGQS